jgi:hypothetical protein
MIVASGVHAYLVTTPQDEHFGLWVATATTSNWIESRLGKNGVTWQVMVPGECAPQFLDAARKLGGITVEEIEVAGGDERFVLLVGEPGTGWAPPRCEHRHPNEDPCGAQAAYVVSVGQRKHDAQASCRRHLAATVDMLRGAEQRRETEIVVRVISRG